MKIITKSLEFEFTIEEELFNNIIFWIDIHKNGDIYFYASRYGDRMECDYHLLDEEFKFFGDLQLKFNKETGTMKYQTDNRKGAIDIYHYIRNDFSVDFILGRD